MMGAARARFDPDIEAALLREYGIDTLAPTTSLRRVAVLTARLPQGSWLDRDSPGSWSTGEYLQAATLDAVNQLTWLTAAAHSKKGRAGKRPRPTPRPGDREPEATPLTDLSLVKSLPGVVVKEDRDGG